MDNLDNKKWAKQSAAAPEGMFPQVRERIICERLRIAQTHRQLVVGSVLLLVTGAFNVGFILFKNKDKSTISTEKTVQMLSKTYFDTTINLSDEK
jgi:hypothetical protein